MAVQINKNNFAYVAIVLSRSVISDSLRPHGLQPVRFLCPWDSPGKNTEVGCLALLQRIFPAQGSSPRLLHLLHLQAGSLPLVPPGKHRMSSLCQNTWENLGQLPKESDMTRIYVKALEFDFERAPLIQVFFFSH